MKPNRLTLQAALAHAEYRARVYRQPSTVWADARGRVYVRRPTEDAPPDAWVVREVTVPPAAPEDVA